MAELLPKLARSHFQQKLDKTQKAEDDAKAAMNAEQEARTEKSARLKDLRLAKENEQHQAGALEAAMKAKKKGKSLTP